MIPVPAMIPFMRYLVSAGMTIALALTLVFPHSIHAEVVVTEIEQVSSARVGRTAFDYTYAIRAQNTGEALSAVVATVSSSSPHTVVLDGTVALGDLVAGGTTLSEDTFTIRQDRTIAFDPSALQYEITGTLIEEPETVGQLLVGDPDASAIAALTTYIPSVGPAESELVLLDGGAQVSLSSFTLEVAGSATIGEINALLESIPARVTGMLKGFPQINISFAAVSDFDELGTLAAQLESEPSIVTVAPILVPNTTVVPPGWNGGDESRIDNHVAARLPAAWNFRDLTFFGVPPAVVVVDFFGRGQPSEAFFNIRPHPNTDLLSNWGKDYIDKKGRNASQHGYHVLGTITNAWQPGLPKTGAYFGPPLEVALIDLIASYDSVRDEFSFNQNWILQLAELVSAHPETRFLINLSIGKPCLRFFDKLTISCSDASLPELFLPPYYKRYAPLWTLNNATFIIAAGNDSGVAGKLTSLVAQSVRLRNPALIVENRVADQKLLPNGLVIPEPRGLNPTSNRGGNISAVGTGVWSAVDPKGTLSAKIGTSMAAPQVTGVLAYLYALLWPEQTGMGELEDLLLTSAGNVTGDGAPVLDAYAAVLALDELETGGEEGYVGKIRRELLNMSGDPERRFTIDDVAIFVNEYFLSRGTLFHEFDLNGDSSMGPDHDRPMPFNLDRSPGGSTFDFPTVPFIGEFLGLEFNEQAVSDLQVLCYYVFGPYHFEGDKAEVEALLQANGASCGEFFVGAEIQLNDSVEGWENLPGTIRLFDLEAPETFFNGVAQGTTCGFGEQGGPVWSSFVKRPAWFYGVRGVTGVPFFQPFGPNILPCSSFIAFHKFGTPETEIWINATQKHRRFVSAIFSFSTSEWQVRMYSGEPNDRAGTRSAEVGVSINEGNYLKYLDLEDWSFRLLYKPR